MTNVCAEKLAMVRRMRPASFTTAWFWRAGDSGTSCVRNFTFLPYFCQRSHATFSDMTASKPTITNVTPLSLLEKICCKIQWMKITTIRSQRSGQSRSTWKVRLSFSTTVIIWNCNLQPFFFYINCWKKWKYYVLCRYIWRISLVK